MADDALRPAQNPYPRTAQRACFVWVAWQKTVPKEQARWEKGMYANQNTVTKLRNKFTLEQLAKLFGLA